MTANSIILDPRFNGGRAVPVINATNLPAGVIVDQAFMPNGEPFAKANPLVAQIVQWTENVRSSGAAGRHGGILSRDRYVTPSSTFEQIRLARQALRDDIVGNAADNTENLALDRVSFFAEDKDQRDIWNQWAEQVDLDSFLRKQWRTLFTDSQVVQSAWWEETSFKVRGKRVSRESRKTFSGLLMPTGMTILDTVKVTPVGSLMFGKEQLAYIATRLEGAAFDRILGTRQLGVGPNVRPDMWSERGLGLPTNLEDPIVERLILERYHPSPEERIELQNDGIRDTTNLFLLDPRFTSRHTLTRPDYLRFSDVRMAAIFGLLDIKQQLRQMDRTTLIGGANFIILITQGAQYNPGKQEEIDALRAGAGTLAQTPIMVGDERLHVEIITPKLDSTVSRDRWDTIDVRIAANVYSMFVPSEGDNTDDIGKLIGRALEGRRRMMRRWLERQIIAPIMRANDELTEKPKLRFSPARIALDFDQAWAMFLLEMRANGEVSRETILSNFGLDQALEAMLRKQEEEEYDPIFKTQVAFSSPDANPTAPAGSAGTPNKATTRAGQRAAGRAGGRAGGAAPGTGQGEAPRRPGRSRQDRTAAKALAAAVLAELLDEDEDDEDGGEWVRVMPRPAPEVEPKPKAPRKRKTKADPEGDV